MASRPSVYPRNLPWSPPRGRTRSACASWRRRDLSAILNFSLYKSLLSLSWKTQVEAEDKLPNCQAVVRLNRDGFKPQKRKTIVEKETSSPLWNQLFYFEDVEVAEGELDACSIQITVQDRTSIGRSLTIGTCDLNLASVYQMDGHEVWKEWMTLTDAKGKREGLRARCACASLCFAFHGARAARRTRTAKTRRSWVRRLRTPTSIRRFGF